MALAPSIPCCENNKTGSLLSASPRYVEHLQAIPHLVAVVLSDVAYSGDLRSAFRIAIDLFGYDPEIPIGAFNHIAIAPLTLSLQGIIQFGGIIDISEEQLVEIAVGMHFGVSDTL